MPRYFTCYFVEITTPVCSYASSSEQPGQTSPKPARMSILRFLCDTLRVTILSRPGFEARFAVVKMLFALRPPSLPVKLPLVFAWTDLRCFFSLWSRFIRGLTATSFFRLSVKSPADRRRSDCSWLVEPRPRGLRVPGGDLLVSGEDLDVCKHIQTTITVLIIHMRRVNFVY